MPMRRRRNRSLQFSLKFAACALCGTAVWLGLLVQLNQEYLRYVLLGTAGLLSLIVVAGILLWHVPRQ